MFIKSKMIKEADFYVKLVDAEFLKLSKISGIKIILTEGFSRELNTAEINIYRYKYDPTKDFKGPLIVANTNNYKPALEYIKKHPNRVFAIIADLNSFVSDEISHLNFVKSLSKIYSIPLLYGSGAKNGFEFVPPIVLNYALEFFYGEINVERKKLYKALSERFYRLLGDERYFEKI
ncbi:MAG: hypothetical protein ACP5LF_00365 [Nitrososphaeria archaeon]